MQKQLNIYIGKFLPSFLCGYRKVCTAQFALTTLIEKWKICHDQKRYIVVVLMDLSKAFDTINHGLLIAKLYMYGFSKDSLEIILSYLSNHYQRVKVNAAFSSCT